MLQVKIHTQVLFLSCQPTRYGRRARRRGSAGERPLTVTFLGRRARGRCFRAIEDFLKFESGYIECYAYMRMGGGAVCCARWAVLGPPKVFIDDYHCVTDMAAFL